MIACRSARSRGSRKFPASQKAARGELSRGLPVGFVWDEVDCEARFHPDEAVCTAIGAGSTGTAKRTGLFNGMVATARKISSRLAVRSTIAPACGRSRTMDGTHTTIEPTGASTTSGQCSTRIATWVTASRKWLSNGAPRTG
jgi:hypothetical protein